MRSSSGRSSSQRLSSRCVTPIPEQQLGGRPDHVLERLADLVHACEESETRARAAKEELDLLRRELAEVREREELLERENVMMGVLLASAEMARDSLAGSSGSAQTVMGSSAQRQPPVSHSRTSTHHSRSPQPSDLPVATSSASVHSRPSSFDTKHLSVPPSLPFATLHNLRSSRMSSNLTQMDNYSEYADQSFDSSTSIKGLSRPKGTMRHSSLI